jgi:group I intron endonuclease
MYIYKITNLINNKIYIGKAKDIQKRFKTHEYLSKNPKTLLHNAIKKNGIDSFKIEEIGNCVTDEEANEKEKYFINYYNSLNSGYNLTTGGDGGDTLFKLTPEQRELRIEKIKKTFALPMVKLKLVTAHTGIPLSEEHKKNLRLAHLKVLASGFTMSKESRQKISVAHKGKPSTRIDYHHTEETRRKISLANKGKVRSEEIGKRARECHSIPIIQMSRELKEIQRWKSSREASRTLGICNSGISRCCLGKRKTAGGFVWVMVK